MISLKIQRCKALLFLLAGAALTTTPGYSMGGEDEDKSHHSAVSYQNPLEMQDTLEAIFSHLHPEQLQKAAEVQNAWAEIILGRKKTVLKKSLDLFRNA